MEDSLSQLNYIVGRRGRGHGAVCARVPSGPESFERRLPSDAEHRAQLGPCVAPRACSGDSGLQLGSRLLEPFLGRGDLVGRGRLGLIPAHRSVLTFDWSRRVMRIRP